jgi:hypothetical protein
MEKKIDNKMNTGFGEYKKSAVNLLKKTIDILDTSKIPYFITSGTLLGCIRHNDIIPWDDDIDLIVDSSILQKLPAIFSRYQQQLTFLMIGNYLIKICFSSILGSLPECKSVKIDCPAYNKYILNKGGVYNFPFIDLFIYNNNNNNTLTFFNKEWDYNRFFPTREVKFVGIKKVKIPRDPNYFLSINYGSDYMTNIVPSTFNHREEKKINNDNENKSDNEII